MTLCLVAKVAISHFRELSKYFHYGRAIVYYRMAKVLNLAKSSVKKSFNNNLSKVKRHVHRADSFSLFASRFSFKQIQKHQLFEQQCEERLRLEHSITQTIDCIHTRIKAYLWPVERHIVSFKYSMSPITDTFHSAKYYRAAGLKQHETRGCTAQNWMLKSLEITIWPDNSVRKSSVLEKSLYDKSIPAKSVGQFGGSHKQVDL